MRGVVIFYICSLLVVLLIYCSCSNAKKAQKQVAKISVTYPEVLAEYCAEEFPVKEIFLPGDTITVTDTLFKDGGIVIDTVITKDTVTITKTKTLPAQVVTKTIRITDTVFQENTASLKVCELERGKVIDLLTQSNIQKDDWHKKAKTRFWVMWSLIVLVIILAAWKIYGWFK